ncbi:MAG: endopeptidase La [Clostridia bacterium]|nr:endopeptidase La [Clostridia bacterium]
MPTLNTEVRSLPVIAMRGVVAFPGTILTFDAGRDRSVAALEAAMGKNQRVLLVAQRDLTVDEPTKKDLYKIGCVAVVRQLLKLPDGSVKVIAEGKVRAELLSLSVQDRFLVGEFVPCFPKPVNRRAVYLESLIRRIKNELERYAKVAQNLSPELMMAIASETDLELLCDRIADGIAAPYDDKQYLLEQLSPVSRAKLLLELLSKEREIAVIDHKIGEQTRRQIDDSQREYYLKEQMRVISDELYGDDSADEIDRYYESIAQLDADDAVKERLRTEVNRLSKMPQGAHDGTVVRTWLDTCLCLPWRKRSAATVDIEKAEKILDRDFYGMKKVKERILEMLSVYALSPDITGQILCLVGPPGVGKTSIGKTVAECMGRSYARVALGGLHDEAEIRGHRKTYIGAMPGRIISAVKQAGNNNPLLLLDEIDKVSNDYRGDPSAALLEVLDPEQNHTFCDNFIELPFDLSHVVFLMTANNLADIPAPLQDRMEIIELEGYTREEKFQIAKRHLVAKELARHGLTKKQLTVTDSALYGLIDSYTREAGVRRLERAIASLCAKSAKKIAAGEAEKIRIREDDLESLLGKKRYRKEQIPAQDEVGLINGLAWTAVGGEIMQLEVAAMPGTGKIELTGSLGDVMKESAKAAVSFVRANAERYGIDAAFYQNTDIHIHATEAAVPKDGPSAGVTITTALISALTGREIKRDIAMTGEVTIRGCVLPIGGLKEKSMAAYRGGVTTVFIPKENEPDIDEVDETVRAHLQFVPVSHVGEIIDRALRSAGSRS